MSEKSRTNSSDTGGVNHWIDGTEHAAPVEDFPAEKPSMERDGQSTEARRQLFIAIDRGNEEGVRKALQDGASPNDVPPNDSSRNWPALHCAIHRGDIDVVHLLLKHNADPNRATKAHQNTALHFAVSAQRVDMVELLLQHNADLNATDDLHQTAFDQTLQERYMHNYDYEKRHHIATLLAAQDGLKIDFSRSEESGLTALHVACALGWADIVQRMLEIGASLDTPDADGWLPLHFACQNGNLEVVIQLLKAGASSNVADMKGKRPLHVAAANDKMAVISELIARGALLNVEDGKGRTPIFEAAKNGSVEAIAAIIDAGALLKVHDATGRTPLHVAAGYNHGEAVRKLVALGADVNAVADDGSKPFHDAMLYGGLNAVEQLIEDGAETSLGSSGSDPIRILEPAWNHLLQLPFLGHHYGMGSLALSVPKSTSIEQEVCKGSEGAFWPWKPTPFVLATPSIHKLLYSSTDRLLGNNDPANASWIHLPANNKIWIQDIFKMLYNLDAEINKNVKHIDSSPSRTDEDDMSKEQHERMKRRKLSSILAFIEDEFSENQKTEPRDVKRTRIIERSGRSKWVTEKLVKEQMIAVAIPVLDIDLRKPYYDKSKVQRSSEFSAEKPRRRNGERNDADRLQVDAGNVLRAQFLKKVQEFTAADDDTLTAEEKTQRDLIRKLVNTYGRHGRIDLPVSLDQYFHESIDEIDLNMRNGDQLISRFIARQRAEWEANRSQNLEQQPTETVIGRAPTPLESVHTPSKMEAGLGGAAQSDVEGADVADKLFRQRIITVPKLWIWKLDDNTIITSFPRRLDQTTEQSNLTQAIWSQLTEMMLNSQQSPGERIKFNADEILDNIVQACLKFQPFFKMAGKQYNYPDVFAAEIAFVSRQVSLYYNLYEASLGKGAQDLFQSNRLATECLITIDDILNEMAMIRRVMRDQGRVLLSLQTTDDTGDETDPSGPLYNTVEWGFEGMRSAETKHMIARMKHLEKDATMVRTSISTLMDLLQRQVAIEMAMSSEKQSETMFRQSSILFIFTFATVLFTPLAWVSSFMALNIERLSPDKWGQGQVTGAHIGTGVVTWIMCAFGLFAYLRQLNRLSQ